MARFAVTETKTVTLVHLIEADSAEEAIQKMQTPGHPGLCEILEDDFDTEYEAETEAEFYGNELQEEGWDDV